MAKQEDAMKWVVRAASNDETRPAMCGVKIETLVPAHADVSALRVAIACDGRQLRLAVVDTPLPDGLYHIKTLATIDAQYPNWRRIMPSYTKAFRVQVGNKNHGGLTDTHALLLRLVTQFKMVVNPVFFAGMDGDWQLTIADKEPNMHAIMLWSQFRVAVIMPIQPSVLEWAPPQEKAAGWEPWTHVPAARVA